MEFMDALGKRLGEAVKTAQEKSVELIEIGKLNIEILKEEEAVRKLYRKIGELVYDAYDKNGDYAGVADAHCVEISEKKSRIDELNKKIEEIKKAKTQQQNKTSDTAEETAENTESDDGDITDEDSEAYATSASNTNEEKCPLCGHKKS